MSEYDYIVVGGGSSGCVMASRLSADPACRVLLIESGRKDSHPWTHVPATFFKVIERGRDVVAYVGKKDPGVNDRDSIVIQGHVLGRGSSVNAMIYIRGHANDYNQWAQLGNRGWSYEDVLPAFRDLEDNMSFSDGFHGQGGELHVSDPRFRHPLSRAFVRAAQEAGLPFNPDFNGARQEGVGFYQSTTHEGRRWSAAQAFLRKAKTRPNLTIRTRTRVARVLFEGRAATGVALEDGSEIRARREVVLCAGAIETPRLLQLSGVGPGAHLQSLGIPVVSDLPGVGENYQDHLECPVQGESLHPISLYRQDKGLGAVRHVLEYLTTRSGVLTSNVVECGGFADVPGTGQPDIQFHVLPFLVSWADRVPIEAHGISVNPCFPRPKSRGSVRLRSPDPRDKAPRRRREPPRLRRSGGAGPRDRAQHQDHAAALAGGLAPPPRPAGGGGREGPRSPAPFRAAVLQDLLPSVRHRQDGPGHRSAGRRQRAPREGRDGAARRGRLRDADAGVGQHERAHDDDRRASRTLHRGRPRRPGRLTAHHNNVSRGGWTMNRHVLTAAGSLTLALLGTSALAAPSCGANSGTPATGTPIKVGGIHGDAAPGDFSSSTTAAAAYCDCVNANGGIQGRPIEYIVENDQWNPEMAAQAASKLLRDEDVVAMVGNGSFVEMAVNAPLYREENIMAMAAACGVSECFESSNIVSTKQGPLASTIGAAQYMVEEKGTQSAVCIGLTIPNVGNWSCGAMGEYMASKGLTGSSVLLSPASPDVNSGLLEAIATGADTIIVKLPAGLAIAFLKAAEEQALGDSYQWASSTPLYDRAVPEALGAYWDGKMFINAELTPWDKGGPDAQNWLAVMDAHAPADAARDTFSQSGYLSAKFFVDTLLAMDPAQLDDRAAVTAAIKGITGYTSDLMCGVFYVGEADRHMPNHAGTMVVVKDGGFETVRDCYEYDSPYFAPIFEQEAALGLR